MIKGIEVGGVMYGITLADDMVGQGLMKDENGVVGLKILEENRNLAIMAGLMFTGGALCLNSDIVANQLAGSGLEASGGKLSIHTGITADPYILQGLAYNLSGSGLVAVDGKLMVSGGGGGSVDAWSLAGSGLRSIKGNKLALALSGSNLLTFGPDNSLDINLLTLSGLGLEAGPEGLSVVVSSGLSLTPGIGLKVKIAEHYSGLRLFFNEYGELDVTQD